jgi:hypothetical protein
MFCYIKVNDKVYQDISKTKNRPLGETGGKQKRSCDPL